MQTHLLQQSLDPGRGRVTTAFERTLLPGFARWFVEKVESCRPDYLVPAETKGARLLDVVLDYARNELGMPVPVPVLYRPALAYMSREELSKSRILVLDDAMRTGNNFTRHRRRLEEFGATDVHAAICICYDPEGQADPKDSYLYVEDADEYQDYIGQMTELVVASGLPPEVDHHVFELELPGLLQFVWGELETVLAKYGDLSIDAPEDEWGALRGMTLHFPDLPGTRDFPAEGAVRNDGPRKVRLFPDRARNRVYVVPVSFPALDLPPEGADGLSLEAAKAQTREWSGAEGSIGELLVSEATERDPETVFRALSAFAEVDVVCGLGRVLAAAFPAGGTAIHVQRSLVDRLYGASMGSRVAAAIERQVGLAIAEPAPLRTGDDAQPLVPLFLDDRVVKTTARIAADLREMFEKRARALGHDPEERLGRSLVGISGALGIKRLLTSRCVDFGLALTTLVPYVDVDRHADGSCRVERKYRVSENERGNRGKRDRVRGVGGERPAPDRQVENQEIAEGVLAYTAMHLGKRSSRYGGHPLPLRVATQVIAIMRPLLHRHNVHVEVRSTDEGLRAEVRRGVRPVPIASPTSPEFALVGDDEGVEPTERFLSRYAERATIIDRRNLTMEVETFLDALIPLLDAEIGHQELDDVLAAAAMSTDGALGLTHVQVPVEIALNRLEAPLKLIAGGRADERSETTAEVLENAMESARANLRLLEKDWSAAVRSLWQDPSRFETFLLRSMGAPEEALGPVYLLPASLISALEAAYEMTERLDEASTRLEEGTVRSDLPKAVLADCGSLRQALASLRPPAPVPDPDDRDAPELIAAAADGLLDLVSVLRAFAAACAIDYRGPRRGDPFPRPDEADRFRTVLFPDLAGSKQHARDHTFDYNFDWKSEGLGIMAQWGRAFGGMETRDRQGDCLWLEFEENGDPAVLSGAVTRVQMRGLRATGLPHLRWPLHLGVHFGRIKDDDGGNRVGLTIDEMNALCRAGEDASEEKINVSQDVLDSCSEDLCDPSLAISLTEAIDTTETELPVGAGALWAIDAATVVERFSLHLGEVSKTIVANLPEATEAEAPLERVEIPPQGGEQAIEADL